jgi:hypothetical protein
MNSAKQAGQVCTAPARSSSQMEDELGRLNITLDELGAAVEQHISRISCVLTDSPPTTPATGVAGCRDEVEQCIAPLADQIRSARIHGQRIIHEVRTATDRLGI